MLFEVCTIDGYYSCRCITFTKRLDKGLRLQIFGQNPAFIPGYNCNYILFTSLPWPGDSEGTFRSSSQAATCPPVYLTRWRLHTVPLIAYCSTSSKEAANTNFYGPWLDQTRNRTLVYRFSSRRSMHLITNPEMETGRVDQPVGLPAGSRFFDRPVKPVQKPVEFSFLATKRHLSSNRNVLIYFIINKTFYKKSVLTNHTFRKHLLNGFKL